MRAWRFSSVRSGSRPANAFPSTSSYTPIVPPIGSSSNVAPSRSASSCASERVPVEE